MQKGNSNTNYMLDSNRSNIQEELKNFYSQMEISPNHSFNNLDTHNFEYCASKNQMGFSEGEGTNETKVKNILAHYLEENDEEISKTEDHATESVNQSCCDLKKQPDYNFHSFSDQNYQYGKESPSSDFRLFQHEDDIANDLSSSEKLDFFDINEQTIYKQKLSYTTQVEDFIMNCTPNPFCFEAQKAVEKIFLNKRIEEMKKKRLLTKKLMNKYQNKKEKDIFLQQSYNQLYEDVKDNKEEPNISPRKIFQKEFIQQEEQIEDLNKNSNSNNNPQQILPNFDQSSLSINANQAIVINNNMQKKQQPNNKLQSIDSSKEGEILRVSKTPCKCRKSLCLKLYCECFARGEICGHACVCLECKNSKNHLELRNEAIKVIEAKNPSAFLFSNIQATTNLNNQDKNLTNMQLEQQDMAMDIRRGCNCKKSKCKKKYCECYMIGKRCSSLCQCLNCSNNNSHSHTISSYSQSPIQHNDLLDSNQESKNNSIIKLKPVLAKEQKKLFDIVNQEYQNIQQDDQSLLHTLKDSNKQYKLQGKSQYQKQESPQLIKQKNFQNQILPKKTEIFAFKDTIRHTDNQKDNTTYSQFEAKQTTDYSQLHSSKENKINLKATKKIIKTKKVNHTNYY
ncbi:tesmin TSO1-like CXC domain protein (macronuclear) [Tetrahymena thermophila SB210]|uniref:Tesmin TSO1-like CXC domain protein n=1 Tax=Tetrahymena thermophila (strain SB210) TaxID=312017 RepID=I7LZT6_TETTS|nr:tesmin TSO1-like CXC domain protein [Tetrahymena thermophila SB210]EAR84892.3 tesmin TSO1-like CXC domain protein [Tetrahymena thermophila SB210]|eukprot:XP_001032555.3 tesmin TSO1-like CXC domain protein [Tetrahymena thermophila SB210]